MSFYKWLEENHPEDVQEGFLKNLAVGAAIAGAGAFGGMKYSNSKAPVRNDRNVSTKIDKEIKSTRATSDDAGGFLK